MTKPLIACFLSLSPCFVLFLFDFYFCMANLAKTEKENCHRLQTQQIGLIEFVCFAYFCIK